MITTRWHCSLGGMTHSHASYPDNTAECSGDNVPLDHCYLSIVTVSCSNIFTLWMLILLVTLQSNGTMKYPMLTGDFSCVSHSCTATPILENGGSMPWKHKFNSESMSSIHYSMMSCRLICTLWRLILSNNTLFHHAMKYPLLNWDKLVKSG